MVGPEQGRPLGQLPRNMGQEANVGLEVGHWEVADGWARASDGDGSDGYVNLLQELNLSVDEAVPTRTRLPMRLYHM